MSASAWQAFDAALEGAAARGTRLRFWLRDDDAVDVTPALERLSDLCAVAGLPVLLAVIPAGITADLAGWLAAQPLFTPCQHGLAHTNHAASGERACELGGDRPDAVVLAELRAGRGRLRAALGPVAPSDILVPPWNRIRDSLVPQLPALGFTALSTFKGPQPRVALPRLDCDLDIIDWRNGRHGRSDEDLCARLVRLIDGAIATGEAIGLLTHHLAHDEAAWGFLARLLARLQGDGRVAFTNATAELARLAGARTPDETFPDGQ